MTGFWRRLLLGGADGPELVQGPLTLRAPHLEDYTAWRAVKERDRAWLQPMQPRWHPDHLEKDSYHRRLARFASADRRGAARTFHLFAEPDGRFVGFCQLAPIQYGPAQIGTLGYWVAKPEWGQGFATHAVTAVCEMAFGTLGLHRIEAHCLPRNKPSARVLEKAGFACEGRLKGFLEINGEREDHLLYAKVA